MASELSAALAASPLLAEVTPAERSAWRAPVGAVLGVIAGLVAALIAALLVIAVYLILAAAGGRPMEAEVERLLQAAPGGVTFGVALAAVAVIACANAALGYSLVALAALMVRRTLGQYVVIAARFRWRHLLAGLALTPLVFGPLALLAQQLGFDIGADPRGPPILSLTEGLGQQLTYLVAAVGFLVLAASVEEVVFRSWLLRQIFAWTRNPWVALGLSGVLFAAVHLPRDATGLAALTIMGATFGWMALRLGGLEYAIGAHAAHNSMIILFLTPMSFEEAYPTVSLADFGFTAAMCAGYLALAEIVARRWPPRPA